MARYALVFVVLLAAVPSASASLSPRKDLFASALSLPREQGRVQWGWAGASAIPREGELRITAETEVRLNGRPCDYKEVPADARIRVLKVGPDGQTILRVDFRK
jgi:hypothetical protein